MKEGGTTIFSYEGEEGIYSRISLWSTLFQFFEWDNRLQYL